MIFDSSIKELRDKIVSRETTSYEVVKSYIENIDKSLNAYIYINEEQALEKAKEIDKRISEGERVGSLAGIPISIKDNILCKDMKTTAASKMLENFISPYDATLIEKIKSEDGIIIGKTNMSEFGIGDMSNTSIFGKVNNPIDNKKILRGSCSGSAVSVKAKEAKISVGTDSSGSTRKLAAQLGLVGYKPSYGAISRYGLISLSDSFDTAGIIGNNVEDIKYLFNILKGIDCKDSTSIEVYDDKTDLENIKLALPKELIVDLDREVLTEFNKVIKILTDNGAIINEVDFDIINYSNEIFDVIYNSDVSSNLARFDGIRYGYRAEDYEDLDELYKNTRSKAFGSQVKKSILFGTYLLSENKGEIFYNNALKLRTLYLERSNQIFEDYDLIICPSISKKMSNNLLEENLKLSENNLLLFSNILGTPSISLPIETTDYPVGIQFIANQKKDISLLNIASKIEEVIKNEL